MLLVADNCLAHGWQTNLRHLHQSQVVSPFSSVYTHCLQFLSFRLTSKMWLQSQKGHTVSMASGRPALPPSPWQNIGFTACCLPSLASRWHSSGAFTSPFSLSCTSGQLYRASRASWLRFSASAVFIPSMSTPSAIHSLKLLARYSAMSVSTCRKKYEWHFSDGSIPNSFFLIISLVPISSFKLLSQQQFMSGLSWSRTKKSFAQFFIYTICLFWATASVFDTLKCLNPFLPSLLFVDHCSIG